MTTFTLIFLSMLTLFVVLFVLLGLLAGLLPLVDRSREVIHQAGLDVIHIYSAGCQAHLDIQASRQKLQLLEELAEAGIHKLEASQ